MSQEIPLNTIEKEVAIFFHHYALEILIKQQIDMTNKRQVKEALLEHYEQIYPAFSQTEVFERCFQKADHEAMVAAYRTNFSLLLEGCLPSIDNEKQSNHLESTHP